MRSVLVAALLLCSSVAFAGPMPKGRWKPLFVAGKKWTFPITKKEHDSNPTAITLEITDVRKVGTADVATLAWDLEGTTDETMEMLDLLPAQIAITKKGVYAFGDSENATDKTIAAALKKRKPTFKEPTRASVRKGRGRNVYASGFAFIPPTTKEVGCFGFDTTDPDLDYGGEPTTSWLCFDSTDLVGVFDGYSAYGRDVMPDDLTDYVF